MAFLKATTQRKYFTTVASICKVILTRGIISTSVRPVRMVKFHTLSKTNYKFGFGLFTSDLPQFHLVQSTTKMKSVYLNVNVSKNANAKLLLMQH